MTGSLANGGQALNGPRWLIYALGGGSGHLARSLALARAAARRGHHVRILSNSPLAPMFRPGNCLLNIPHSIDITPLDDLWERDPLARCIRRIVVQGGYDVLVVDTFPRGLAGELADLLPGVAVVKVLVHRTVSPRYVDQFSLQPVSSRYDLILMPGEQGVLRELPQAVGTQPWLLADASELLSPDRARGLLRVPHQDKRPLVVVSGCGKPDEWKWAAALSRQLDRDLSPLAVVRLASLAAPSAVPHDDHEAVDIPLGRWPLLLLLRGVDILVGAGGYNTVYEARATSTPLLALPQPRLYDNQAARLHPWEQVTPHDLPDRIRQLLLQPRRATTPPAYVNGVDQAVKLIEGRLCGSRAISG